MLAIDATMTALDFEATGVAGGHPDEPWQIGIVRFVRGVAVPDARFESLLRVGDRPFSRHAPGRHAMVRTELHGAPRLSDLWPRLRPWLCGCPLVAHQTGTEKRLLAAGFPLQKFGPWIDTLKLARLAFPRLSSHKLSDLLFALGLEARVDSLTPGRAAHDAVYDAAASAVLLEYLLCLPRWREASVEDLARAHPARFHRLRQA